MAVPFLGVAQGGAPYVWFWVLVESVGVAAVAGGVWLWKDEPRGYRLSALVQAIQIIQIQTAAFGFGVMAGFQVRVYVSPSAFTVGPAFYGTMFITSGADQWWVTVNLFAIFAMVVLMRQVWSSAIASQALARDKPGEFQEPAISP